MLPLLGLLGRGAASLFRGKRKRPKRRPLLRLFTGDGEEEDDDAETTEPTANQTAVKRTVQKPRQLRTFITSLLDPDED